MQTATRFILRVTTAATLLLLGAPLSAQDLHTNDRWEECSIVLDPTLTQSVFHQFVREAGLVTYFRPMASAAPLGAGNFEVGLTKWGTRIDERAPAWNETFSHPDSEHYLVGGSTLQIPGVMARVGLSDRIDVGGYVTKSPGANYGFVGGQLQYNLLRAQEAGVDAAGRLGFVRVYGPEDVDLDTWGLDFTVSREVSRLSPYAQVSTYLARGRETTTKVALEDEDVLGLQATLGMTVRASALRLGGELNLASVPGFSIKVAFGR
jgi:hypothetical protein